MCQVNVSQKKNLVWNLIQIEEFPTWRNGCSYISLWTSLAYKKPVTLECFFLEYLEVKSRGDSTREATKRETPRRWRARHNIQEATGRPDKMSLFVVDTYLPLYRLSSVGQDEICEIWSKLRQKMSYFLCIWTLMQVICQQTKVRVLFQCLVEKFGAKICNNSSLRSTFLFRFSGLQAACRNFRSGNNTNQDFELKTH